MTRTILLLVSAGAIAGCVVFANPSAPLAGPPFGRAARAPDGRKPGALPVQSVAVLPLTAVGEADPSIVSVLNELVLPALSRATKGKLKAIGKRDVDAILGFERTRDLAGCDDVTCTAEVAGALGVESIIAGTVGKLGQKYILTLNWLDNVHAGVLARHSETLGASVEDFDAGVDRSITALMPALPESESPLVSGTYPIIVTMGSRTFGGKWSLQVDGHAIGGTAYWSYPFVVEYPLHGEVLDGRRIRLESRCAPDHTDYCPVWYVGTIEADAIEGKYTMAGWDGSGTFRVNLFP